MDFTVDDLPLESSAERGNLDTRTNTNNIINTILPFDTKNAVKWNASYLSGFTSEKRDLRRGATAPAPGGPAAVDRPRPGRGIGEPLRSRRALGAGTPRRARHALGVDVPAGLAVFVPPARQQRRHAALHRGERPHRRDHGQRAGAAVEAADWPRSPSAPSSKASHSGSWGISHERRQRTVAAGRSARPARPACTGPCTGTTATPTNRTPSSARRRSRPSR